MIKPSETTNVHAGDKPESEDHDVEDSKCSMSLPDHTAEDNSPQQKASNLDGPHLGEDNSPSSQLMNASVSDDESSFSSDTQSSTMTMSTTGSFGLIKAAFMDEFSRVSNHRCERRLIMAAREPVDMIGEDDAFGSASVNMNDESSATSSSIGSFIQQNKRKHLTKRSSVPTEISFTEDYITPGSDAEDGNSSGKPIDRKLSMNHSKSLPARMIMADDSDASESPSTQYEQVAARNEANDVFEKAERAHRAKVEDIYRNNINSDSNTKSVTFSIVEIRQYERILGDHPSCTSGPPISIGWEHDITETRRISVVDHSSQRRTGRSSSKKMRLSRQHRIGLLLNLGFTERQLVKAIRKNRKDKRKRNQTIHNLNLVKIEEIAESAKRKIKKSVRKKKEPCEEWTPKEKKTAMRRLSMASRIVKL